MDTEQKSRTQKKNADRELQKIGESFVSLSAEELEKADLPQEFLEAVQMAQKIKSHQAKRRQLQRIGAIIREIDPATIQHALRKIKHRGDHKAQLLKKVEVWCLELQQGSLTPIDYILTTYPETERQRLAQLARNAHKTAGSEKEKKTFRTLVNYVTQIVLNANTSDSDTPHEAV